MVVDETALPADAFGRPAGDVVVVYDGECPFCSNFVQMQRLRANVGRVALINARDHLDHVQDAKARGLDIDKGMLVFWSGRIYEGGDAVNIMAVLGDDSPFARFTRALFKSPTVSRALYPALRAGRNGVLALLGRRKMASDTAK